MEDTLISVIAIALAVILMFVFPLMTMSDRADDVAQLTVEVATTEFVDEIRTTGKITPDEYSKFLENIGSTGNTYNIEMEIKIQDENPDRKITMVSRGEQIGENAYYSIYTSQIENVLNADSDNIYKLKEGDIISVSVNNTNQTLSQQLKNFFYTVIGKDTYTIAASHGGKVTATGK
ncbi:MAG: hypothetical protein IJE05_05830 [Clostridia bacterium]|nr:hypothetical protein [Clostridia bacterium]